MIKPKIRKICSGDFTKRNFAQKWGQVQTLREIAWKLKAARMRSLHPEWSETQVQNAVKEIFLYGIT